MRSMLIKISGVLIGYSFATILFLYFVQDIILKGLGLNLNLSTGTEAFAVMNMTIFGFGVFFAFDAKKDLDFNKFYLASYCGIAVFCAALILHSFVKF